MAVVPSTQKHDTVSVFHIDQKGDLVEWLRAWNGSAAYRESMCCVLDRFGLPLYIQFEKDDN